MKYEELTGRIIAAALEVHKIMGTGFQEVVYQRSLSIEFEERAIAFKREYTMILYYKGQHVGKRRVDFLVENIIPVEIKAVSRLEDQHIAQALNYIEALNLEIGLLLNFGSTSLEIKRLYNAKYNPELKTQL